MKQCTSCKKKLPLKNFNKNKSTKDGLHRACRKCKAKYQRRWYKKHKKEHIVRTTVARKKARAILLVYLKEYLLSHPCVDCGETDPVVLEFDHVRGKKSFNVSQGYFRSLGLNTLKKEIAKCDVRCANCHRRQTAIRGNWQRLTWRV